MGIVQRFAKIDLIVPAVLVGIYTPLSLYAQNLIEVQTSAIIRPLLFSFLLALLIFICLSLLFRDPYKGSILSSVFLFLIFSYGHFYNLARQIEIGSMILGRHRYFIPLWVLLGITFTWLIGFRIRNITSTYKYLQKISIVLVLTTLLPIFYYHISGFFYAKSHGNDTLLGGNEAALIPSQDQPDVYYIITDEYARFDVLESAFDYDNFGFSQYLEDHGFYVAYESNCNYPFTQQSLASSLNMSYIQDIMPEGAAGPKYEFNDVLNNLIRNNVVRQIFVDLGYDTVGFASGFWVTEFPDSNYFFAPDTGNSNASDILKSITPFESMIIDNSIVRIILDYEGFQDTALNQYIVSHMRRPFQVQRGIVIAAFENLKKTIDIEGPKFVFTHILSPHGPFKFGPNGEAIDYDQTFTLKAATDVDFDTVRDLYVNELQYLTDQLKDTIDYILTNSHKPTVIILQSDHGASPGLNWEEPTEEAVRNRAAILNAYYLPDECKSMLYPSVSPVNSFRILFNCIAGGEFVLLEDTTYLGYDIYTALDDYLYE